jgi:16S rRNA (cytosine967-C5)-methyltransferase
LPERADRAGVAIETRLLNPKQEAAQLADLKDLADVVLVDAPCSGSGTWRRNPELRWRITSARLDRTLEAQAHVLDLAAPLVKPGGALVYAVCSLFAAEGDSQIQQFLARQSGWGVDPLSLSLGRATDTGYVLTPAHDGTDGFFVARLTRNS